MLEPVIHDDAIRIALFEHPSRGFDTVRAHGDRRSRQMLGEEDRLITPLPGIHREALSVRHETIACAIPPVPATDDAGFVAHRFQFIDDELHERSFPGSSRRDVPDGNDRDLQPDNVEDADVKEPIAENNAQPINTR